MDFEPIFSFDWNRTQSQCVEHEVRRPICEKFCKQCFSNGRVIRLTDQRNAISAFAVSANRVFLIANVCPMLCIDSLAEWSKALAPGASPQGRGFEPHSCHFIQPLLSNIDLRFERVGNQRILSGTHLLAGSEKDRCLCNTAESMVCQRAERLRILGAYPVQGTLRKRIVASAPQSSVPSSVAAHAR